MERPIDSLGQQWRPGSGLAIKYEDPYPLDESTCFARAWWSRGASGRAFFCWTRETAAKALLHADGPAVSTRCRWGLARVLSFCRYQVDLSAADGHVLRDDIYRGAGMERVPRGTIKTLRVVEAPAKRFWTQPSVVVMDTSQYPAVNYNCTSTKRILGDGSGRG
jgi:hypothetical protein